MYKEKLVGDDIPEIWKELNQKIKEKVHSRRRENDTQSKLRVTDYIKSNVQAKIKEKTHNILKKDGTWEDVTG